MTVEIIVLAALVLVPGVGAALALARPGAISIESRIALGFGLGYAIVAGAAILLALAHLLSRPSFVAAVVIGTVAVWVLALRRASPRAHLAGLGSQAGERPFTVGAGLVLLLAVAAAWAARPAGINLGHRPAWRYWADGLEVAATGHVPTSTGQWGMEIPTTVNKVVLNAFEAGVSYVLGPAPLPAMHAIVFVVAVGIVAALLALGRELGLGAFAPLLPALVVLVPPRLPLAGEMSNDLRRFTAENVGRMAAFCAVIAAIHAWRARDRWMPALVAGVLLALAALTHGVPTLIAGLILVLFALGTVALERRERRRLLTTAGAMLAVFVVSYPGIVWLSGGDLGFQRAGGASFLGFPADVDPTRSFSRGRLVPPIPADGHFLVPPRQLIKGYAEHVVNRHGAAWPAVGFLAALFVLTCLLVWRKRSAVPLAAVAWGLAAAIVGLAFFFSYRYETQIPGVFGVRRLYDYAGFTPALVIPALLEAITQPLGRRRMAVAALPALVAGALAVAAVAWLFPRHRPLSPARAGSSVIQRVSETIPCEARMLANARTAGTWEATTGRRAITEGMAPFLRPAVLGRVLPILVGANEFFRNPRAHAAFLERERVQYLVVIKPHVWFGWGGTGRAPREGDAESVAALPGVDEIVRDRWVSIFSVGAASDHDTTVEPRRCPL